MRSARGLYNIVKPWRLMLLAVAVGPGVGGGVAGVGWMLYQASFGSVGRTGLDQAETGLIMSLLGGVLLGYAFGLLPSAFALLFAYLVLPLEAVTPLRFGIVFAIAGIAAAAMASLSASSSLPGLGWISGAAIPASVPAVVAIWYLAKKLRIVVPYLPSI